MQGAGRGSAKRIVLREAAGADMPGIARVRFSVRENSATPAHLERLGITNETVAASLLVDRKGWVAEHEGEIVAFSMADRADRSILALFVQPEYEGRGLGSTLLDLALQWLWQQGARRVWLATGPGTRAQGFYERRGWTQAGDGPGSDIRMELGRPPGGEEESP
jgi:GNAT superfamily N-acetyltransferase